MTATVEYPRIVAARAASKFNINGPVLLANALAAFALNLVRCCSDLGVEMGVLQVACLCTAMA